MSEPGWSETVRTLAADAPEWMRERASAELHIGGFTQAQLDTPVLDLLGLDDVEAAARTTVFFLIVAAASGASVARVQCDARSAGGLVKAARNTAADAIARIDDENVSLMRYFDVFLEPADSLSNDAGARLIDALKAALSD